MTRQGCSNEAALAAAIGSSDSASSVTMTSVRTRPRAIEPPFSRRSTSALLILEEFVVGRSMITGCSSSRRADRACRRSWSPPRPTVTGHHRVRAGRPPGPRQVLLDLGIRSGPMLLDRVENLPGKFDLFVLREQRRLAE